MKVEVLKEPFMHIRVPDGLGILYYDNFAVPHISIYTTSFHFNKTYLYSSNGPGCPIGDPLRSCHSITIRLDKREVCTNQDDL